jgi:hypothetical protein
MKNSLQDPVFSNRFEQIEEAHKHTLGWFYNNPATGFKNWLIEGNGVFWISGKPGSGKSTLMKYILNDSKAKQTLSQWATTSTLVMAGFFFHDRGTSSYQKSFDGLLRSILHQILTAIPEFVNLVLPFYKPSDLVKSTDTLVSTQNDALGQDDYAWKTSDLENAFLSLIQQDKISGRACLFLDALDEYDGGHIHIAEFVESIVKNSETQPFQIKICASSRDLPVFEKFFGTCPGIRIQDWTRNDISQYIMDYLARSKMEEYHVLAHQISIRAEGVFLWVRLALDEIRPLFMNGDSVDNVLSALIDLPKDLEGFYQRILRKVESRYYQETYTMLQLVLCDPSLSFLRFTLVVDFPLADEEIFSQTVPHDLSQRCKRMEIRIKSRCGGLIEIRESVESSARSVRSTAPAHVSPTYTEDRVQFMHQSVKEYVRVPENLISVLGGSNTPSWPCIDGHVQLARFYFHFLGLPELPEYAFSQRSLYLKKEYGILASDVIPQFLLHIEAAETSTRQAYVQYVDAFNVNMGDLVPINSYGSPWFEQWTKIPWVELWTPDQGTDERMTARPPSFLAFALCARLFLYVKEKLKIIHNDPTAVTLAVPLCYAIEQVFIINPLSPGNKSEPAVYLEMIKLLLEHQANPNQSIEINLQHVTPFSLAMSLVHKKPAALTHNLAIIRLLLDHGANPNEDSWRDRAQPHSKEPPLHILLSVLYTKSRTDWGPDIFLGGMTMVYEIIEKLLDKGADPNAKDGPYGKTALERALYICPYRTIEKFMECGAKITEVMAADEQTLFSQAHGILDEERWRRPECYDDASMKFGRKWNPQWKRESWLASIRTFMTSTP